jgi:hypothetical protein
MHDPAKTQEARRKRRRTKAVLFADPKGSKKLYDQLDEANDPGDR